QTLGGTGERRQAGSRLNGRQRSGGEMRFGGRQSRGPHQSRKAGQWPPWPVRREGQEKIIAGAKGEWLAWDGYASGRTSARASYSAAVTRSGLSRLNVNTDSAGALITAFC